MFVPNETTAVILCGGTGSRLSPITDVLNKHVLAIYSKPMLYYPISVALQLGIRALTLVCNPADVVTFSKMLAHLDCCDITIDFVIQPRPDGICDALLHANKKIKTKNSLVILGDNIFYGLEFIKSIQDAVNINDKCRIFTYTLENPQRFGVIERNTAGKVIDIVEKPEIVISQEVVTGLYFFEQEALVKNLTTLKKSDNTSIEVTNLFKRFLEQDMLSITQLSSSNFWIDAGVVDDLFIANEFVRSYEQSTGHQFACLEEIAFKKGWLSTSDLERLVSRQSNNSFRLYLQKLLEN